MIQSLELGVFAFCAGFVDAVAGGGGLVQLPGLFIILPNAPIATLLGTNKFASFCGTAAATVRYLRTISLRWQIFIPCCGTALAASWFGAQIVSKLSKEAVRPLVLFLLGFVWVFTLLKKDLGNHTTKPRLTSKLVTIAVLITATVGFYDGFFGAGTGGFLLFLFVVGLGMAFLEASALAKLVNLCTNLSALVFFLLHGNVAFQFALPMAVFNVAGGLIGSRMAISRGSVFVRKVFLIVTAGLFLKLGFEVFRP